MIGSVTEAQQQMAELAARREAAAAQQASPVPASVPGVLPGGIPPAALKGAGEGRGKAPRPTEEHLRSAEGVMRQGFSAPVSDRNDAAVLLEAAGRDPRKYDGARAPDDSGGARDLAADLRERARDKRDRGHARKNFEERGATEGPDESLMSGRPEPQDFDRPYLGEGHASPSPMSGPPRVSPFPPQAQERGIVVPIELSPSPVVLGHLGAFTETMAAHESRGIRRPPIPDGEPR